MLHRNIGSVILCVAPLGVALLTLAAAGCDGNDQPDASTPIDAGPGPSELFGACEEDSQCPGEGAVCRPSSDGWPGGFCTVPCEDRTPCDARGVYHHCVVPEGETQGFCERRCLNGIDCGRDAYTCEGELPPSGGVCISVCSADEQCGAGTSCDLYTGRCVEGAPPTAGGITGEACAESDDCRSGACVAEASETGVPTGWVGGSCTGNCVLPSGFNSSSFYNGEALPAGTCPGAAVCLPVAQQARGDLGRCYAACVADSDCRPGYACLRDIALGGGGVSSYSNGACVPDNCEVAGCPAGYDCVTVTGSDGSPRSVCGAI